MGRIGRHAHVLQRGRTWDVDMGRQESTVAEGFVPLSYASYVILILVENIGSSLPPATHPCRTPPFCTDLGSPPFLIGRMRMSLWQ
jgi:hypothetical protein